MKNFLLNFRTDGSILFDHLDLDNGTNWELNKGKINLFFFFLSCFNEMFTQNVIVCCYCYCMLLLLLEFKRIDVKTFSQLEKNVIMVAYEGKCIC